MPEGHTIHRYARLHRQALGGRQVRVDSPQGRFAGGAARIDGSVLADVTGYGKHLLYHFDAGTLHVHLGLFGRFRSFPTASAEPPGAATRLRLRTDDWAAHLSGPAACELLDADAEDALLARLGPDPLRPDADPQRAWEALQRRRAPIGQALLDQAVIAGIGNVFRAEALFRAGVRPDRSARDLAREEFDALWADLAALLTVAERSGRIVTVDPADVGADSVEEVPDDARVNVYRRADEPCRRCGAPVASWRLGGRTVFACPVCQPA